MKKATIRCFTTIFLACATTILCFSQNSVAIAKLKLQPRVEDNSRVVNDEIAASSTPIAGTQAGDINKKVLKNFERKQKGHPDAKWFKSSAGLFVAFFTKDGIQTFVYYNQKGAFEFMIRYYKEEKLPTGVRDQVSSTYYDYNIYQVTEVTRNDKVAYALKIEDKTSWKTVKIIGGEMEVMEEYTKR